MDKKLGGYFVRKLITLLLMLILLVMPGNQGLLAQEYSGNPVQNYLAVPQIEASSGQLVSSNTEQEQVTDNSKQVDSDDNSISELTKEQPAFDKESINSANEEMILAEKNEEIDKILREISATETVNEGVYSARIASLDASDPIPVLTALDLFNIKDNLNGNYVQMADIDLSAYPNWDPIDMFNGTYDGNGYEITNLTITRDTEERIGLFGDLNTTSNCSLKNINLLQASVTGKKYVGGLAGWTAKTTKINNCKVSGLIIGVDSFIGGVVGVNAGEMKQCKFIPPRYIDGLWGVGGLVGFNTTNGTITQCYSVASVYGSDSYIAYTGGLAGINGGNINNCYAMGNVIAPSYSGGLVGHMVTDGLINSCYAASYVNCPSNGGGLVGDIATGTVSDSYYDKEISDKNDSDKGEPKTTAQMKQQSTYINWNFDNIWGIISDKNMGYPYLRSPSDIRIPVIIIPGIMGSELYADRDDYKCWPNIHINDGLERLHINNYGESDEDITARGLVKSPDYYSRMIKQLQASGFKIEEFPYDWRIDNDLNAELLHDKIDSTLQKYNADKVDIVAHSMGGLVSKAYLGKYGSENKVRKLVAIGTPHLGAPKMFGVWKTGELEPGAFISIDAIIDCDTVKYVTRNFSSIYQLLPSSDDFYYSATAYYEEGFDTNDDRKIQGYIYDYSGMKEWFYGRDASLRYNDVNIAMLDNAEAFHAILDK